MTIDVKNITLLDETIREGDARGYHPKSPAERLSMIREIHSVMGVRDFCLGWCVIADNDWQTLIGFLEGQRAGTLPTDLVAHLFELFSMEARADEILATLSPDQRSRVAVDFGTVASDLLVKPTDGKWFGTRSGIDMSSMDGAAVHARLCPEVTTRVARRVSMGFHHVGLIIQDVFRARYETVANYIRAAREGGASVIRLHDTVGIATPATTKQIVESLCRDFPDVKFFGHFHNDFGMATANALAALEAGACGVDVTVNGVGNRAGNARSAEIVMALKVIYGIELPGVRYDQLTSLSRNVERYFGLLAGPFDPIIGRLLHLDEASPRTHHMQTIAPTTWLPFDPREVGGGELDAAFTLTSGKSTVAMVIDRARSALTAAHVDVSTSLVDRAFAWVNAQLSARADAHVSNIRSLQDLYEQELRRSYVTENDLIAEALRTQGRFDTPST